MDDSSTTTANSATEAPSGSWHRCFYTFLCAVPVILFIVYPFVWAGAMGPFILAAFVVSFLIAALVISIMACPPGGGIDAATISAKLPAPFEFEGAAAVEECAMCLAQLRVGEKVRRLQACGHMFHAGCVDQWLHQHATCPLCRAAVIVAGAPQQRPAELPV